MIFLGADHGGYKFKEKLKEHLQSKGYEIEDLGTHSEDPIDYPVIAKKVALKVIEDANNRGIVLCRSGTGVCIAANKIAGIRAAEAASPELAKAARNDDNVNVLCLAADYMTFPQIKKISETFLTTAFGAEERYKRRLKQIELIEKGKLEEI